MKENDNSSLTAMERSFQVRLYSDLACFVRFARNRFILTELSVDENSLKCRQSTCCCVKATKCDHAASCLFMSFAALDSMG